MTTENTTVTSPAESIAAYQSQRDACCIISFVLLNIVYISLAVVFWRFANPATLNIISNGDQIYHDKCNVTVVNASIHHVVDLVCSEMATVWPLPKLNIRCSDVKSAPNVNHPLLCNPDNNGCAPYCFEEHYLFGDSPHIFDCSWDATKMVNNVTFTISPLNERFNRTFTFSKAYPVNVIPEDLKHRHNYDMSNQIMDSGILKYAYCSYAVNIDGVIYDAEISITMSPFGFIIFFTLQMLLCGILYGVLLALIAVSGGMELVDRILQYLFVKIQSFDIDKIVRIMGSIIVFTLKLATICSGLFVLLFAMYLGATQNPYTLRGRAGGKV